MRTQRWLSVVVIGAVAAMAGAVRAEATAGADESCPRTRAEVRNECVNFMKSHRWDEQVGDWVLKSGAPLPEGVTPREKVRAERDAFMRANKWNEMSGQWEPVRGAPREISKLSRAEVQKETAAFMRTHQWDEATATYVLRKGK